MITTLTDTTASEIEKTLATLREEEGLITLSRVATLVIVTHPDALDEPIHAAVRASQEHPARIIVILADADSEIDSLDAEIRVGNEAGAGEVLILKANGHITAGLDTLITPLLLPDAPIVTWWPNEVPSSPAQDPLGAIARRRITDVLHCDAPDETLYRLSRGYAPGDSDLSWSRITKWRGLVAAAYDHPPVSVPQRITIEGVETNPSVTFMKAWLENAFGPELKVTVNDVHEEHGLMRVILHREDGDIRLHRSSEQGVTLSLPGSDDQFVTMPKRSTYDLLSEELRRLDPDEVYAEVLAQAFPANEDVESYSASKPLPADVVLDDVAAVVEHVAKTSVDRLAEALKERGTAHIVLTGGRTGTAAAIRIAELIGESAINPAALHVWWGDERFVGTKSKDRNDAPVLAKLANAGIPRYNLHTIPSPDAGMGLDDAAAWYSQQLTLHGGDAAFATRGQAFFDVLLLGVGPDGHVASLFPGHPDAKATTAFCVPVRKSPKPPAERISMAWPVLNSARHVSFIVTGEDKADAVANGHADVDAKACPASAVRGLISTTWHMDKGAAAGLEVDES